MTEITDLTAVLESPPQPHLEMEVLKRQSDQSFQSLPFKTAVILGLLLFQTAVIFMEKMWVGDDFRGDYCYLERNGPKMTALLKGND